jgi:hypothetical protein
MGDAHRGKVEKITQVQRHTGIAWVAQTCAVHNQDIRVVRQLSNHLLQHLSFPEVQKSCPIWSTSMTPGNPCGGGPPSLNYDRSSGGKVTFNSTI